MVIKGYIQLGNAKPIGLASTLLINICEQSTVIIGSENAFDISNIVNVLKIEHVPFTIKSKVELSIYPNLDKMQHWVVINSIINITYQSLCQKD